jgi:hypothetical protein
MVSNIGYRFLARTGGNNLYLGNCNRVCYAPITWVFDGADGTGVVVNINENNIKSYSDSDLSRCNLSLRSGLEQYFPENIPQVIEGARLVMYAGLQTASAIEYVKYATYIIDSINYDIGVDRRGMTLTATNEALWNLTGLSMPFYAEILGKSACFDPMQMDTSMLSAVGNGCIAANSFQVDFWDHEGYTNTGLGITPVDLNLQGGVNYYEPDAPTPNHWFGIIMREEIQYKLALNDNPVITDTTIHAKAYGWSSCPNTGDSNDHIHIMIQVTDDEGVDHDYVATGAQHWKQTYFDNVAGTDPVEFDFTAAYYGFEVGWKIKKVGLSFYSADDTRFCPARVEFTAGVRAFYPLYGADTPWETEKDWGYYKLPKAGKPFIMIATGPYNAFNFSLAARFKNDVEDLANYGAFTGLVGHCEDGLNYTVGRYDKRTGYAQIVICRDGIEQILDDALVSFTVIDTDDTLQMRFDHKDGHFELYMVRVSSGCFEKVLDYDWEEANGYMYTSDIASMRCGIYGFIEAPLARTLGYQELGDEEDVSGQGIPFDPLWSTANFPSNGTIRLEDNVYQYYTKVAHPSYSIGPYQFRCMGWYDVDLGYGDGYALDCRDFDWLADEYSYDGYIVTISSGVNFIVNRIDWQIFITTGGSTVWLRNRCRIYSADVLIGKLYHSLSNKVWVTGGLLGDFASDPTLPIKLISGEKATHSEGEFAVYERAGEIFCYWYQGTGGEDDTTIGDMVQKICDLSGAQCQFPSDYTHGGTNLTVTTTPQDIQTTDYAEGFDLSFDVASFGSLTLRIDFNAKIKPDNYENKSLFEDDTDIRVNITYSGSGNFVYSVVSLPSNTVIYSCQFSTNTGVQKFRVMAMGNNIGFYHNGQWVTTVALNEIDYENSLIITLSTSTSSLILSNIRESDLSDWREAIYIDLETDGTSALSSVIQQRPIEMFAKPDGSIDFWYDATRTTVTAGREPRTHSYSHVFPSSGASDAIIYGLKDVKTIQDENFARVVGFATKMMRMPDLGIGAMRAAHIILKRLLESAHKHSVDIRPDLELEPGDVYTVSYDDQNKVPSARTASIVVEAVSYEFRASEAQATARMQIQGREEYDEPA